VRAANPGTGRAGPDPYGDAHHTSVRPASRTRVPAGLHGPPEQMLSLVLAADEVVFFEGFRPNTGATSNRGFRV
jgi:hypothetical protein